MPASILFIFTSAGTDLKGGQTGWFLPEAAHPYYILSPHYNITFAAPKGPNPPVDEGSVSSYKEDKECVEFLEDPKVKDLFANTLALKDVKPTEFDVLYYVGGHGPVIDLPFDPDNIKLLEAAYATKSQIISAVCHGTAALAGAKDIETGKPIIAGKRFTGFSTAEEEAAHKVDVIPFLLESKLTEQGGIYEKAEKLWGPHITVDGLFLTGQNPASAGPLGEAIHQALSKLAKSL